MVPSVPKRGDDWPPTERQVIDAKDGVDSQLAALLASGIPKLVSFYRGMGLKPQDAEDLAADTCEALVKSISKLRDPSRFEPWFWRIARSKFYDHLRRNRRSDRPTEREGVYDDPSDALITADEHASIREAFATLKARDRDLLWMRDVVGLPYAEIAGRLTMKEGAVRIAVMRARQRLEDRLSELEQGVGE